MNNKTQCIVLRTVKYGDNRLIIDLLSREEGRLSVAWKVTTSAKSKIRKQFFQPLTILDIDFNRSQRQQIAMLTDARLAEVYESIPFDGAKMSIAFFTAEFLLAATYDLHTDTMLYDFVEQSLLWLDATRRGIANFHLMFMMRLSRFLGFHPDTTSFREGAFFDLREGSFCSHAPLHTDFLSPTDSEKMLLLMRMTPSNLHLFRMSRAERNRTIDLIIHFYRIHLPSFGELKSLAILREL